MVIYTLFAVDFINIKHNYFMHIKNGSWTLCGAGAYNKTEAAVTAKNRGNSHFPSNPKGGSRPRHADGALTTNWNEIKTSEHPWIEYHRSSGKQSGGWTRKRTAITAE